LNKPRIYLSEEIIKKYLTKEKGKDAVNHFHNRILLKGDYEEGVDYWEATLEEKKEFSDSVNLQSQKKSALHKKKRYFVSGECYKLLLQQARTIEGKKVRKYFIKVESLARFMMYYLQEYERKKVQKIMSEANRYKELSEMWGEELQEVREMKLKRGSVYIMSTKEYAMKGKYKVGYSSSVIERSKQLNTGRLKTDPLVVLYELESYDYKALESQAHKLLASFRCSNDREFFKLPFLIIVDILKIANESIERASVHINEFISAVYNPSSNADKSVWYEGVDMSLFDNDNVLVVTTVDNKRQTTQVDITDLTKEQIEEKISKIIADHIKNTHTIEEEDKNATLEELHDSYEDLELRWWHLKPIISQKFQLKPGDEITPYKKIVKSFSKKYKDIKFQWNNR